MSIKNKLESAPNEKKDKDGGKGMSRRDFIYYAGAGLLSMAVAGKVQAAEAVAGLLKNDPEKNPRMIEIIPDYEKELEHVLVALDWEIIGQAGNNKTLESSMELYKKLYDPNKKQINLSGKNAYLRRIGHLEAFKNKSAAEVYSEMFGEFFQALPDYSKVTILTSQFRQDEAEKIISSVNPSDKVEIFPVKSYRGGPWTQDFGKTIKLAGQDKLIIPKEQQGKYHKSETRNDLVRDLLRRENIDRAKFFFEGGNLIFDRLPNGTARVFVGYDIIEDNLGPGKFSKSSLLKEISETFGGAEVVVMGNNKQEGFFHIDQSFVILANGKAVVNQFNESQTEPWHRQVKEQHDFYRKQLESLGYSIIPIYNSWKDLAYLQSSTNAVPFVDKMTKQRKIIFPVFPGEVIENYSEEQSLSVDALQGKGLSAYNAYKSAGYLPIPIRDMLIHFFDGNIHCLTNVLAKSGRSKNRLA